MEELPIWKQELPATPHKLLNNLVTVLVEFYGEHLRRDRADGRLQPGKAWDPGPRARRARVRICGDSDRGLPRRPPPSAGSHGNSPPGRASSPGPATSPPAAAAPGGLQEFCQPPVRYEISFRGLALYRMSRIPYIRCRKPYSTLWLRR